MATVELCEEEATFILTPVIQSGVAVHTFRFTWLWPVADRETQFLGVATATESATSEVLLWGLEHLMALFDDSD